MWDGDGYEVSLRTSQGRMEDRQSKEPVVWGRLAWLVPHVGCEEWGTLLNASVPPQLDPHPPNPRCFSFFHSLPFPFVSSLPRTGPSPGPSLCSPKCPCLILSTSSSVNFCLQGLQLFLSCVPWLNSSFSPPSVLSSPTPNPSQLTSSRERHLCSCLHLKSQRLSL